MEYRALGRTGIKTGIVGLGAEHLEHAPTETVVSVVHEALDGGANYIDLFMGSPGVRDNCGAALKGRREDVLIAGHLGATWQDGQYVKSRDPRICREFVDDLLKRVGLDCLGVLMLHFVDESDDLSAVLAPGGLLDAARALKEQGKARCLGLSTHMVPAARRAVESGVIDVLMFPVNPLFDLLPGGTDLEGLWKDDPYAPLREGVRPAAEREELYHACAAAGVGIVAMKPYAAGWLFNPENAGGAALTPVQCLDYALSRPGVCTVVPGCKTAEEMRAALAYLSAGEKERDYGAVCAGALLGLRDRCMYCNHCLPCPSGIDIGAVTRLADTAARGLTGAVKAQYASLAVQASSCSECGQCRERCPFGIDAPANVRKAAEVFGSWPPRREREDAGGSNEAGPLAQHDGVKRPGPAAGITCSTLAERR